jgi:hypothetical protein
VLLGKLYSELICRTAREGRRRSLLCCVVMGWDGMGWKSIFCLREGLNWFCMVWQGWLFRWQTGRQTGSIVGIRWVHLYSKLVSVL